MARLQVLRGMNPGQEFALEADEAILGRHPECDIVVDVGAVSREHAKIIRAGGEFFVEDLKSRNGTYVNNQLIKGRQRLEHNDKLKICDVLFAFLAQAPKQAARPEGDSETTAFAAEMIDDAESGANIMSTLDIQSSRAGVQVGVNAEVKLKALLEITRNMGSAIALDQVLLKVLDSLFKIFLQADRGFVVLADPVRNILIPKAVKHRRPDNDESVRISRTIVNRVMTSKEAILSADAASDSRFDSSQSVADFRIRSMMCAPLVNSEGKALGVIQIDTLDQRSRFQQDDLDVLASVACQAATAVENAQLHEAAMKRQALERDLQLAHKVQQGILPSSVPQTTGYEFFDFYQPANQVGGDYFDYVVLPGQRIAVVVADVSGKGMPAALLMAKLSSETRYCLVTESNPANAMMQLNAAFSRGGWEDRFVTTAISVIDLKTHRVTIVNAGHMAPFLRRSNGQIIAVGEEKTGVPLGVDSTFEYESFDFDLGSGELLTFFTDGFSEAMNVENNLYGLERLQAAIQPEVSSAVALGNRILTDVKKWIGARTTQSDDMCLICFGRTNATSA